MLGEARPLDCDRSVLTLDEALRLPPLADETVAATSCNAPVQAIFNTPDRTDQIVDALSLPVAKLSNDQVTQLKALIAEFPDVFALSDA